MRLGPALQLIVALALAPPAIAAEEPRARYLGSFDWDIDAPWFGGFSGLELADDGRRMMALSDRGMLLTARIARINGQISDIVPDRNQPLKSARGTALDSQTVDSEGLVLAPDGTVFISFERMQKVARYESPDGPAQFLNQPRAFRRMRSNGSLEALAMDNDGRLLTLPENGVDPQGMIPVFRWDGRHWSTPFSVPARGRFLPVGADIGPDGRLYLLERDVGLFGFRSRLRRWDLMATELRNEQTLFETRTGTHDNLEGLAVWRDADGVLRATMIADDNFSFFQRTEIVEYAIIE